MKKTMKSAMLLIVVALAAVVSSCSSDDSQLQSSIPANSTMVASIDGKKVFKAMDAKIENGNIVLPESISTALNLSDKNKEDMKTFAAIAEEVEYESIYAVLSNDKTFYITFEAKDAAKLGNVLVEKAGMKKADAAGFDAAYESDRKVVLLRDKQAWLLQGDAARGGEAISRQLKLAESDNFAKIPGVSDMLAKGDNAVKMAISAKSFPTLPGTDMSKAAWAFVNTDIKDNAIVMNMGQYDNEGNKIEVKNMKKISTDFLRYLPDNCNMVVAMGISKDMDWDAIFAAVSGTSSLQGAAMLNMLKPYLRAIDGTVAVGVGVNNPLELASMMDASFESVPFFAMVQMEQEKVNEAISLLVDLLKQGNMPFQQLSNGTYSITSGDIKLNFGSVNGALALSSSPLKAASANNLAQVFEGKYVAASFDIPSLDMFALPVRYGMNIKIESGKEESTMKIKLTGTTEDIIPALVSGFANFLR